jgi:ribosomal protein S18 acetylase RimI-like enzyme
MGIRRTFRSAPAEPPGHLKVEAAVEAIDLEELLDDFQSRLFRVTPTDFRPELKGKFEQAAGVKVVWRSPKGRIFGAALATFEGRAADLQFLHILPRSATVAHTAELLDALLRALPADTTKVRAMGNASSRWLHLVPGEARAILLGRGFSVFNRTLVSRDLSLALPPAPQVPEGWTVDQPDPRRVEEWGDFAYRAYQGTTDFGIIALEATPQAYRSLYQRFLSGEFGTYERAHSLAVRTPDGALAGVLHTILLGDQPYVGDLSVLPEYRRRGLGRALLLSGLQGYVKAGMRRASLTVTAQNTPAYNLYRSVGFEVERSGELYFRFA